jgi:hypothetical protein
MIFVLLISPAILKIISFYGPFLIGGGNGYGNIEWEMTIVLSVSVWILKPFVNRSDCGLYESEMYGIINEPLFSMLSGAGFLSVFDMKENCNKLLVITTNDL